MSGDQPKTEIIKCVGGDDRCILGSERFASQAGASERALEFFDRPVFMALVRDGPYALKNPHP
jgi:hypothetical protein